MKLHSLLQTASAPKKDEACYLLGKLETPLRRSLDAKSETFSWLVPIVRTLMDQCYETLQLQLFLPSLPPTNGSPTFYEDFQLFCTTPEWRSFIEKHVGATGNPVWDPWGSPFPGLDVAPALECHQAGTSRSRAGMTSREGVLAARVSVRGCWCPAEHPADVSSLLPQVQPTMAQFEMDTFAKSHDHMSNFWNACYDAMMSSSLRRERDKADSRKMFQVLPPPRPGDVSLGTCSLSQGHAPHPRGVTQRTCSSPQGCHPRDVLLTPRMCSSPRGHAPHPRRVTQRTCSSPQGCAPHPRDVILETSSSPQRHRPSDVFLTLGMSS